MRCSWIMAAWCLFPLASLGQEKYVMEPGPKSPAESLKCIKPRPGFTVELMAAEPLVMDPIAFAWGADGKFWVVEMGDYPLGVDAKNKFGGKVKFLEKSKADGPYDKSTLFLDNLGYPTGVFPWGKGVLITCAPDIFYAEDADGDGKADKKIVLFTGFVEGNQQHRVNGLSWGLDNWIYGANGDSNGVIKCVKTLSGAAPWSEAGVNISGRDFRFKPDTGAFEAVTGMSQFGRCRDDWGNWFGCNNSNPCFHFVLDDGYLRRNPHVVYPPAKLPVPEKPGAAPVYPISKPLPRFNDFHTLNHFTSACSIHIYRDDLFGPEFQGNTFVCEPVHNLIHREILTPKGVTFTSKRAPDEEKSEFLASTDNWFRPTMVATGPDGALWVADMYRYVIEHPQWIPKEWQKKLDLRAGHDMGRIYRIYPKDKKPRVIPRLDKMTPKELVAALDSPNGSQRDLAHMLLVSGKEERDASKALVHALEYSENAFARLHALCVLNGAPRGALPIGLRDEHPGVRRHAVRLCRPFSNFSGGLDIPVDQLEVALGQHLRESDPQLVLQLAYTLGHKWWRGTVAPFQGYTEESFNAGRGLALLACKHARDPYLLAAVLSSLDRRKWKGFVAEVLERHRDRPVPARLAASLLRLAQVFGDTREEDVVALVFFAAAPKAGARTEAFVAMSQLLDALESQGASLALLRKQSKHGADMPQWQQVDILFGAARDVVADAKASAGDKIAALPLLGRGLDRHKEDIDLLKSQLAPQVADDVQVTAVTGLARLRIPGLPTELLTRWKSYGPGLRSHVLDVLLGQKDGSVAVLAAVENKQVLPFEIDAARRQRLLEHKDQAVRARAAKLLAGSVDADRRKVVDSYRPALKLAGDPARGTKVFVKHCAACHKLGDVGQQVGPDLNSVADKSLEGLLTAILDPNQAVEARYIGYTAVTKNGVTHSGLIAAETSTSITLVGADGKSQVILRTDLDELFSAGKSAMPEGLEKDVTHQEMADLLAFIRKSVPLQKQSAQGRLQGWAFGSSTSSPSLTAAAFRARSAHTKVKADPPALARP